MNRKESAMCHVPPRPLSELLFTTSTVKHRHLHRPNIYSNTDRKPFDIKLLVFRGKSERNFLFYTRRKNYFHIRLTSFLQRAPSNGLPETCAVTLLRYICLFMYDFTVWRFIKTPFNSRGGRWLRYSPCPGLLGASQRFSLLMLAR